MRLVIVSRIRWVAVFALLLLTCTAVPVLAAERTEASPSEQPGFTPLTTEEAEVAATQVPDAQEVSKGLEEFEREEAEREEWRASPEAAQQREDSWLAFDDISPEESEGLLRSVFSEQLDALSSDPSRYLSDAQLIQDLPGAGAVVKDEGDGALLESSVPVRTEDEDGELAKVDLSLDATAGGYETGNAITDLRLPDAADGAIKVGEEGFAIAQAGAAGSPARQFGGESLFYSEVLPDTDLLVAGTSLGVELFDLLRSKDSPELFQFVVDVPEGAELRSDGQGGAEVVREGEMLTRIPKPWALDSQHAEVPVELKIDGSSIALHLPHRAGDFQYPLLLDPVVEDWVNAGSNWYGGANWGALDYPGPWVYGRNNSNIGESPQEPWKWERCCWEGSHAGLLINMRKAFYGPEQFGEWTYSTGNPNVVIPHVWLIPFNRIDNGCGSDQPHDYAGLWSTNGGWNPIKVNYAKTYGNMSTDGAGESLVIGIGSGPPGVWLACDRVLYAGGVGIWLDDYGSPTWNSTPSIPDTWMDASPIPVSASASDSGLGVHSITLYLTNSSGQASFPWKEVKHGCNGLYGNRCPTSWATQISGYGTNLPNGINPLVVIAWDPVGHSSQGMPVFLKVDHDAPVINLSGPLLSPTPTKYHLDVDAVDGNSGALATAQSGMKSLDFFLDGQPIGSWPETPNPPACSNVQQGINLGSCEFKVPIDLARTFNGQHTLRILAKDSLNHPSEKTVSLNLPKDVVAPTLTPSGPLYAASGGVVQPGTSSVTLTASDSETGIVEGSLFIDGKAAGSPATQSCFSGGCGLTTTFNVSLSGYADGNHTVELKAKDGAGNPKVVSWTIKTDSAPPAMQSVGASGLPDGWSPQVQGFMLTYKASDGGSGIKKIEVSAPAAGGGSTTMTPYASGCTGSASSPCSPSVEGSSVVTTGSIAEGENALTVRAYDATGAVSAAKTLSLHLDRTDPELSATGPLMSTPSSTILGVGTELSLSMTDRGSGVASVKVLVDNTPVQALSIGEMEDDGATQECDAGECEVAYQFSPALEGQEPGLHTIAVLVEDKVGRSTSTTHEVALDTKSPIVSMSGPLVDTVGEVLDTQTAMLEATADDGSGAFASGIKSVEVQVDGVPVNSSGSVWVADKGGNRIQKFDPTGKFIAKYGVTGSGNGQFNRPSSIAIDRDGNVLVADSNNHRIQKLSPEGQFISKFGSFGSGNGQLNKPEEVVADAKGNIWVADTQNGRVQKFGTNGGFLKVLDSGQLYEPTGLDVDPSGNVWVADWQKNRISVFNSEGEFLKNIGSAGSGNGQFNRLDGLEIDDQGNVWVGDQNNNRVQRFNLAGQYVGKFGSAGSGPGQFSLDFPMGIATDSYGHIWVTDPYNNRVQKWQMAANEPTYSSSFGSYGGADGQFKAPGDVAVEASGPCGLFSCQYMFDQNVWGPGPHVVVVTATDQAGNASSEEIRVNEPISAVAPECPSGQAASANEGTPLTAPAAINLLEGQLPGAISATQPSEAEGEWAILAEADINPAISSTPATPSIDEQGFEVKGSITGGGVEDQAAGQFTVGQAACFRPLETSSHALDPTIVNGDVAVFANSAPDTDTVLRPTALGMTIVQHIRGANAPSAYSWEVALGEDEELELMKNGDVAIISPSGVDLEDVNPPSPPDGEGVGSLGSVEAQLEDAAYDIAGALNEADGEVKLVVGQPEIVLANGEIVPGILKIGPGEVITAELPPNTVEDIKAMIIKANPPSEPAHLCALAFASRPDLYFAGCGPEMGADTSPKDPADNRGLEPPQSSNLDPTIRGMLSSVESSSKAVTSSAFGVPLPGESLYEEYKNMTDEEKAFCFLGGIGKTVECHLFFENKLKAVEMEQDLFNVPAGSRDTKANAFRHAYWTALMTRTAAWKNDGIVFAIAHEGLGWRSRKAVTRKASRMDVLNNFVGYFYAENVSGSAIGYCEALVKKVGNAFFLGADVDPFNWRDDVGYEYRNLVFRKKEDLDREGETRIDVLRNGLNCEQVW
jgi:streptogramin lyase